MANKADDERGSNNKPASTDDGGSAVVTDATAFATGVDTLASGDLVLQVEQHGRVTQIKGVVTSTATAFSPDDDPVSAEAQSGAEFVGVDSAHTKTKVTSGTGVTEGEAWAIETSTTKFHAVDIAGKDLDRGPSSVDVVKNRSDDHLSADIDGNLAVVGAETVIAADESFSGTTATAVATDHVSFVDLGVVAVIGDSSLLG